MQVRIYKTHAILAPQNMLSYLTHIPQLAHSPFYILKSNSLLPMYNLKKKILKRQAKLIEWWH